MQYKAVAEIIIPGIDFRPKQRKQASGTEVGKGPRSKTSVPNSENRPLVRKSARGRGAKLPSQMPKTRIVFVFIRNWGNAYNEVCIMYEGRMPE